VAPGGGRFFCSFLPTSPRHLICRFCASCVMRNCISALDERLGGGGIQYHGMFLCRNFAPMSVLVLKRLGPDSATPRRSNSCFNGGLIFCAESGDFDLIGSTYGLGRSSARKRQLWPRCGPYPKPTKNSGVAKSTSKVPSAACVHHQARGIVGLEPLLWPANHWFDSSQPLASWVVFCNRVVRFGRM